MFLVKHYVLSASRSNNSSLSIPLRKTKNIEYCVSGVRFFKHKKLKDNIGEIRRVVGYVKTKNARHSIGQNATNLLDLTLRYSAYILWKRNN